MLLGESIHACACREVVCILRAAMQHDEQGASALLMTAGNIELVVSSPGRAGKGSAQELSAFRDLERLTRPTKCQPIETEWKAGVPELLENLAERTGIPLRELGRLRLIQLCVCLQRSGHHSFGLYDLSREVDKFALDGEGTTRIETCCTPDKAP